MNKLLNIIIIILSLVILILFGFVAYRLITFQAHTISFNLNGVTSIESDKITCKLSLNGCIIKLPNAKKDGGIVLGYSKNKDDTKAKYHEGEEVLINKDISLYAISYKEFVVNIDKNGVDYLESDSVSCLAYNESNSCKIKLPNFNKIGYQLIGYGTSREVTKDVMNSYFQNEIFEINQSMTLYPNYVARKFKSKDKVYDIKETYQVNNIFMEFEKTCSQSIVDTYKKIVDDLNKNAPYLFVGTKLSVLSENTFLSIWGGGGNILGVNYNTVSDDYPLSRSLDLLSSYGEETDKYYVMVHEMGHSFDFYYGYGLNRPATLSKQYSPNYGNQSISSQSDIKALFQKYSKTYGQRPLRSYAYTNIQEFTAESIAYYYMKFIVQASKYQSSYYPDDLKTTIEKYFCIAKNNYDPTGC